MQDKIKQLIVEAIRAKNQVELDTLRSISSAFTNELVALKRTPQDKLTDEEALKVIQRIAKQRKESIASFEAGGRSDLVEVEKEQYKVLEQFLPQMMSEEEVEKAVKAKLESMGEIDKSKSGQIVGMCMKELAGKADGNLVKEIVNKIINS